MPKQYLEALARPEQSVNPLFNFLGIRVDALEPDRAVLRLPCRPELIQGGGMVAGGVLATLLDETMAHAVLAGNRPGERTTTVGLSVSYLRPANADDTLVCEARVQKRGGRVIFVEACARAAGREVARATASFLLIA
ncbi:MAG: PaaI family thioesterase [Desulfovibrionaceae bacterium]|nr:PaaI family thioesterase [Desulfovibrionaceae bacterium]